MASRAKQEKPLAYEAAGNVFSPEERIELALASIDPNLAREDWVKVGMALKSELGESGFLTFDEWSKGGQSYNARDARDTWKSFKESGPITIATLFKMATDSGWRPDRPAPPPPPPDPKAIERQQKAELKKKRDEASAAGNGGAVYQLAKAGQHPYLKAKGVQAVKGLRTIDAAEAIRPGVSFGPSITKDSGKLLIFPILNESGEIQSLEAITPAGVKGYLAGAKKREGFFVISEKTDTGMVYVCEGLATGLSVHQATAARVHVAGDANNLKAVAESARRRFPEARIVIAGDWDESQTGQRKGRAAAAAVNGLAVFPSFEGVEGITWGDWNDLHQGAGIDEVKRQIEAALIQPAAPAPDPVEGEEISPPAKGEATPASRKTSPYSVNDTGTWHTDADGEKTWICAALYVDAMTRNDRGEAWGRLLRFRDPEGREHVWPCPIKLLAGDGVAFREALMELGLVISPAKAARAHLSIYVQTAAPGRFVHCAEQTGWTEIDGHRVFVLPDATIGPDTGTRVLFQGTEQGGYGRRGSLAEWKDSIGRWCNGNSRLLLAVSMAFSGPLLRPCGAEGGGVNFRGSSSSGKTTILRAAMSVTGEPEGMHRMRGTANGIEGVACSRNDGLLILDEMGQGSAAEAGDIVYMLGNGSEKLRGTRTGGVRKVRGWELQFLISAEVGLAGHMLSVGKRARAGQEIRLLDIPSDTGRHGAFEELHGHANGAAFSDAIKQAHKKFYGTAFRAFLERVTAMDPEELTEWVDLKREEFIRANLAGADPSGQAIRAGHRFAIIAAAGELAAQFKIVPWPDGAASWAAKVCFDAWLRARGGAGNQEPRDMLAQVRHFLEQHGESRFTPWACEKCHGKGKVDLGERDPSVPVIDKKTGKPAIDPNTNEPKLDWGNKRVDCFLCNGTGRPTQRTVNAAGYRKLEEITQFDEDGEPVNHRHFFIYPESWKVDICAGFDAKAVTALCLERGIILPDREGKAQSKKRPPGEAPRRFYVVNFDAEGWEL